MRAINSKILRSTVVAASAALLAACTAKPSVPEPPLSTTPGPDGTASATAKLAAGTLLISNGTAVVTIGDRRVTFPTTVTDAAWTPDGSRIVFIDGDGNVSSTRPDGSGRIVYTSSQPGVTRSRPTMFGASVAYAERGADGAEHIKSVQAGSVSDGHGTDDASSWDTYQDAGGRTGGNTAPNGTTVHNARRDGRKLTFQHQGAEGAEVWLVDQNQRTPEPFKLVDGTEPALSPDGSQVAFVARNGQVSVVTLRYPQPKPVQVTFGATSPSHLAWLPDGAHVAFQTASDIESVATRVKAGATANPARKLADGRGVPSFLRPAQDTVVTVSGVNAAATALFASQSRWPTVKQYIRSQNMAPADRVFLMSATDQSSVLDEVGMLPYGPVLFIRGGTLDKATANEITRVLGKAANGTEKPPVTIVGGPDAVPTSVERDLQSRGYATERITLGDRPYNWGSVLVIDRHDPAAIPVAAAAPDGVNVLLVDGPSVPSTVSKTLQHLDKTFKVYAVGATARDALAKPWAGKPAGFSATPLVGPDLTAEVLRSTAGFAQRVIVADRSSPGDLTTALAMGTWYGAPVLAIDPKSGLDESLRSWLGDLSASIDWAVIVDSSGAFGQDLHDQIGAAISGPLGYTNASNPVAAPLLS